MIFCLKSSELNSFFPQCCQLESKLIFWQVVVFQALNCQNWFFVKRVAEKCAKLLTLRIFFLFCTILFSIIHKVNSNLAKSFRRLKFCWLFRLFFQIKFFFYSAHLNFFTNCDGLLKLMGYYLVRAKMRRYNNLKIFHLLVE